MKWLLVFVIFMLLFGFNFLAKLFGLVMLIGLSLFFLCGGLLCWAMYRKLD